MGNAIGNVGGVDRVDDGEEGSGVAGRGGAAELTDARRLPGRTFIP